MAEFLSPGVFIQEVASGESAILGVSTSNFGTMGFTPRGIENKAILATSLQDYFRKFGQFWAKSDVPLAVTAFFKNGGQRLFFVRVTPADAVAASGAFPSSFEVDAISKGAWGNIVRARIYGNDNFYNHATATYSRFNVDILEESANGTGDFLVKETFGNLSLDDDEDLDYIISALNDDINGSGLVRFSGAAGIPSEFGSVHATNETVGSGDGSTSTFTYTTSLNPVAPFTVKIKIDGNVEVTDDGRGKLVLAASASGTSSVSGTIDYDTGDIAVDFTPAPVNSAAIKVDYYQKGVDELIIDLTGGDDGSAITRNEISSPTLELDEKGLFAFNKIEEILNIGLPDARESVIIQKDLIDYCEGRRDCFAILDTPKGSDPQAAKNYKQVTLASQSTYAGIYHPGINVSDPVQNSRLKGISPVGHIAGVFARTDTNRNVGKAPAGVNDGQLAFCVSLEQVLSKGQRDFIYPANVNPLIDSTATGRAVWGVRTLAITGDFTLVNVRRLFIFLEKSTFNSTHDLVFEPIGSDLFALVKLRMVGFLNNLTQNGYFASRIPDQAYRVVCDGSNNTPATLAARTLITDVYIAPQTPAEFVLFRFQRLLQSAAA